MPALKYIGFETDMDFLAGQHSEKSPGVQRLLHKDAVLAQQAWDLVVALLHNRCKSMAFYCSSWPGLLALFAAEDPAVQRRAHAILLEDWEAYSGAKEVAGGSTFLAKVTQCSPFSTTLMKEVCQLASCPHLPQDDVLEQLHRLAGLLFSCWGQSKIIEDGLNKL
eukprot:792741-Lingulodinium_polyedra.AAC.1